MKFLHITIREYKWPSLSFLLKNGVKLLFSYSIISFNREFTQLIKLIAKHIYLAKHSFY